MDSQTPWGWVSLFFGDKEQGSGINFFLFLFLRNKKLELPLH